MFSATKSQNVILPPLCRQKSSTLIGRIEHMKLPVLFDITQDYEKYTYSVLLVDLIMVSVSVYMCAYRTKLWKT